MEGGHILPFGTFGTALFLCPIVCAYAFPQASERDGKINLTIPAGTPLRVYVTKRFAKRKGTLVDAKVLEPVYAFDRQVIPAGSVAKGIVSRTHPVTKWERVQAILRGDFTPLRISEVEFRSLILPGGQTVSVHTGETTGLDSLYEEPKKKKPKKQKQQSQNTGVLGTARQTLQDRINAQVNGRTQGIAGILRSSDKKERFYDFAMAKLPYHPQYVRRGSRFDAEIREDVPFGSESIRPESARMLGTQPPPESVVSARLLSAVDSGSAKQGDAIEALLTEPLFTPDHQLVLPEGTRLKGAVVLSRRARWFHRGGQLRFNFLNMELPSEAAKLGASPPAASMHTQAVLQAAEGSGPAPLKVDSEGGVKATEPKSRLIAPMISAIITNKAADNDAGRMSAGAANHANGGNVSGRTLGGGLGFGLLGSAIAQSSRYVGMGFAYYGLAWSVYSNIISRGAEVHFEKNAVLELRFGGRTAPAIAKSNPKETAK